ncbi:MAG TPA: hypothetical protein VKU87_07620, partial [Thermomicrobiaceae bacterium]|nr:hypothetical protein [Thermomicrobiaceae bacterium]
MSLPAPRYPEKFTAAGGLPEVMLPIDDGEWETDQNLRTAIVTVVGADYGFDQLGGQPAPLEPASEQ